MKVFKEDGLTIGFCLKGQMRFFRLHGLDFRDYHQNGIDEERLAGIDDHNMRLMIDQAAKREKGKA